MNTAAPSSPAIEAIGLGKRYGERDALRAVDLRCDSGRVTTLFGHNGSGKTTFLKIVASLMRPSSGEIRVAGHELPREAGRVRSEVGLLLDQPYLPPSFALEEGLRYYAEIRGLERDPASLREILARVGLERRRLDALNTFSRGMGQRASLACALVADPELLLLDEPYTGLDPEGCDLVDSIVDDYRGRGRTVILVTHDVVRGLAKADRVVVFARGRVHLDEETGDWTPPRIAEVMR